MPNKVLFGEDDFKKFEQKLTKRGFKRLDPNIVHEDILPEVEIGTPPRKHFKHEVGFGFFGEKGFEVVVWTTYIPPDKRARESDNGWVLIKKGNRVLYYSHPLNRTENFLKRLYISAAIAQVRIQKRPECPQCGRYMEIVRGKGIGSRYWSCFHHLKQVNRGWDCNMPPEAMPYVRRIRKERERYYKQVRAKGGQVGSARLDRADRNRKRRLKRKN